ncbi:DUF7670 domain-containing protein [Kosmotoga olearia]|uniref:DUF7670 domain-containing protein n=1 Tax=Kosmotoga olearia TaxID=651457 RepID=UPI0002F8BE8A|nr:hypothetical protein [Kosmotoga olearia]
MEENVKLEKKGPSRLLLIARIWSVVVIAIGVFIFAGYIANFFTTGVTDPYAAENYPFIENIPPFFSFICIIGLALAWKWKLIGGWIAIIFSAANYVIFFIHWPLTENINFLYAPYGINTLLLVPGILFVLYWRKAHKLQNNL